MKLACIHKRCNTYLNMTTRHAPMLFQRRGVVSCAGHGGAEQHKMGVVAFVVLLDDVWGHP